MELKGRLSTPETGAFVHSVVTLVTGKLARPAEGERAATQGVRAAPRPLRLRLGDAVVAELVAEFMAGTTRKELVDRYGVSLSSVVRLLRAHGARRRTVNMKIK